MNIEDGWRFQSADFSVQAAGKETATGFVTLVRDPAEKARWFQMSEDEQESDYGPPLYVIGHGITFEDAIVNANLAAAHAKHINVQQSAIRNTHFTYYMEFKRMNYPITEEIHQAISEAWEEWHEILSPDLTPLPNLSFIQGFKAAVKWINEQPKEPEEPEEPDDLTVAYMAGIEKGKDIIKSQYSGEPVIYASSLDPSKDVSFTFPELSRNGIPLYAHPQKRLTDEENQIEIP